MMEAQMALEASQVDLPKKEKDFPPPYEENSLLWDELAGADLGKKIEGTWEEE
jgi:hypothetical protein